MLASTLHFKVRFKYAKINNDPQTWTVIIDGEKCRRFYIDSDTGKVEGEITLAVMQSIARRFTLDTHPLAINNGKMSLAADCDLSVVGNYWKHGVADLTLKVHQPISPCNDRVGLELGNEECGYVALEIFKDIESYEIAIDRLHFNQTDIELYPELSAYGKPAFHMCGNQWGVVYFKQGLASGCSPFIDYVFKIIVNKRWLIESTTAQVWRPSNTATAIN